MSHADIFSLSLYSACGGLPLWVPHPSLRLGDVGFLREGQFHVLFNVGDGPPESLGDASSNHLAKRTQPAFGSPQPPSRSPSRSPAPPDTNMDAPSPSNSGVLPDQDLTVAGLPGTRSGSSSLPSDSRRSSLTPSAPAGSRRPSLANRLMIPSDELLPPAPLELDEDAPLVFDMGPRTSNNYRCLGFNLGAAVAGAPVGGTVSFETSGGDGALLMPRDPTERSSLKHIGVLKTYVKTHRKWIFEQYGRPEDMELDEIALVYGQDRTSDWAVAVSKDMARGAKVDLQVFGFGQAGVWCEWKTACTASQRGPHRDQSQYVAAQQQLNSATSPTASTPPSATVPSQGTVGFGFSVNASGPMDFAMDNGDSQKSEGGLQFGISASNVEGGDRMGPSAPQPNWSWAEHNPFPPTETIVIRRITAQHRLGLGFLPTKMQASAGPRKDGYEGPDDHDSPVTSGPLSATDPLLHLHAYIQSVAPSAHTSIASDSDCAILLQDAVWDTHFELKDVVSERASESARVDVDAEGFATIRIDADLNMELTDDASTPVSVVSSEVSLPNWAYAASLPTALEADTSSHNGSYGHRSEIGTLTAPQRASYLSSKLRKAQSHRLCVLSRERLPGEELAERVIVFGKSGRPFAVTVSQRPSCNCPESRAGRFTCAHILYVLLKVLKIVGSEDIIFQKTFTAVQLDKIFRDAPANPKTAYIAKISTVTEKGPSRPEGPRRQDSSSSTNSWKERIRTAASYASSAIRSSPKKVSVKLARSPSALPADQVIETCPICYDTLDASSPDIVHCISPSCRQIAHGSCFAVLTQAYASQGSTIECPTCGDKQMDVPMDGDKGYELLRHKKDASTSTAGSSVFTSTTATSTPEQTWAPEADYCKEADSSALGRRGSAATETTITSLSSSCAESVDSNLTVLAPGSSAPSTPVLRAGTGPKGIKRAYSTREWVLTKWGLSARDGSLVSFLL